MFSDEQQAWLNHLDDTDSISLIPYDSRAREVFRSFKREMRSLLGEVRISHRGSTALKISGQGEIDAYMPVNRKDFEVTVKKIAGILGKPGSLYALTRARFVRYQDGIKIELFVINKNDAGWKASVKFEKYLRNNPAALRQYEIIKARAAGLSTRRYYAKKIAFINSILDATGWAASRR